MSKFNQFENEKKENVISDILELLKGKSYSQIEYILQKTIERASVVCTS